MQRGGGRQNADLLRIGQRFVFCFQRGSQRIGAAADGLVIKVQAVPAENCFAGGNLLFKNGIEFAKNVV